MLTCNPDFVMVYPSSPDLTPLKSPVGIPHVPGISFAKFTSHYTFLVTFLFPIGGSSVSLTDLLQEREKKGTPLRVLTRVTAML